MRVVTASEMQNDLMRLLASVAEHDERFAVTHEGETVAVVIPLEDFTLLQRFEEQAEDRLDAQEADKALTDPGNRVRIPWQKIKDELDL